MEKIPPSEITPEHLWVNRRQFLLGAGALAAGTLLSSACKNNPPAAESGFCVGASAAAKYDERGNPLTACDVITNYNNYYEFSTSKTEVAPLSRDFKTTPWTVTVGGLVDRPGAYSVDELIRKFPPEERVYRFRCVETWAMVVPWVGFPLASLLNEVGPKSSAQFVRFETILDPAEMPGQKSGGYQWPYVEGLRLDEAMHPLSILATGLYGKPLPPQDGAPIRLVVPWKYGFKNIKSIVKIDLVDKMPVSFWMGIAPDEYGFYANVNPLVSHPRWSQAAERRLGEVSRTKTLLFNGYDEVAPLYDGMDLKVNF